MCYYLLSNFWKLAVSGRQRTSATLFPREAQDNPSGSGLLNLLSAHLSKTQKHEHSVLQMTSLKCAPTSDSNISNCPTIVQGAVTCRTSHVNITLRLCRTLSQLLRSQGGSREKIHCTPRIHMPVSYHWLAFTFICLLVCKSILLVSATTIDYNCRWIEQVTWFIALPLLDCKLGRSQRLVGNSSQIHFARLHSSVGHPSLPPSHLWLFT